MFITFEGIEGSGKGTLLRCVREWFAEEGIAFLATREPGGSELGRTLRTILLDARNHVVPEAELFLYLADRAQHVRTVIRPALGEGRVVLSDRYADSTIVYQGYGRQISLDKLTALNEMAVGGLWPHLTVLLDLPPEEGLARAHRRNQELGLTVTEGRFEGESIAFHTRIRQGYLLFARNNAHRFVVVDAMQPPAKVFAEVRGVIAERMRERRQ